MSEDRDRSEEEEPTQREDELHPENNEEPGIRFRRLTEGIESGEPDEDWIADWQEHHAQEGEADGKDLPDSDAVTQSKAQREEGSDSSFPIDQPRFEGVKDSFGFKDDTSAMAADSPGEDQPNSEDFPPSPLTDRIGSQAMARILDSDTTPRDPIDDWYLETGSEKIPSRPTTNKPGNTPPPPKPFGTVGGMTPPQLDSQNMPLPQRVPESDIAATQVSDTAFSYQNSRSYPTGQSLPINRAGGSRSPEFTCLARLAMLGLFSLILIIAALGSYMLLTYYQIRATLPDIEELQEKASQFETTRILDREGNLLYELIDPNAGRRTYVKLENISPYMLAATIATEDEAYYSHPGFSPVDILRAFWQNYTSGEIVSGASTITQQVARMLLFDPEEAYERTYMRKVREALLASELTRRYSKEEILELYLNEIYYGNLAYGVEAAAETYFRTTSDKLNMAQSSFLAGLSQAPSVYDVYTNPDATFLRQQDVLRLMYETSRDQGCIHVGPAIPPVCVSLEAASAAAYELLDYKFRSPEFKMRYPHWVNYIRTLLEESYDSQTIYRSGFTVETTLDPSLQDKAQEVMKKQVAELAGRNVQSGALVALDPVTGEILAMVGSIDYYNEEIDGQFNMAVEPRQPGSSIKPITYVAAFEKGWTPSTLIWDVYSEFPPSGLENDPNPVYVPVNYDERYHGPITVRYALANSYNIPAVKTLQFVGVMDDPNIQGPDGMVAMAHRLGITDLNNDYYGLSVTLGAGEVKLLDMAAVFSVFANLGKKIPPVAITRITDYEGNLVFEHQPPQPEQVIRAEHAYLMTSILSDNQARTPAFGPNSVLNLPFPAAVKTGTTTDFKDNWTIGYTPDLVVAVWVGNPENTPMQDTSGLSGAAPIWSEFMTAAVQDITKGNPRSFTKPTGVVEKIICSISGSEPSEWCTNHRREYFAADQLPKPANQDLWRRILIDTWTGFLATPACADYTHQVYALNVDDKWGRKWITDTSQGQAWAKANGFSDPIVFAPERECRTEDSRPELEFVNLHDADTITESPIKIVIRANVDKNFDVLKVQYGLGENPNKWETLVNLDKKVPEAQEVFEWDVSDFEPGIYSLRLNLVSKQEGRYARKQIRLVFLVPTPTPQPTSTPTETPTATDILVETPTATQTVPAATMTP